MKIVTKVVYTTAIEEDGGYTDTVKKTISITDTSFETPDAESIHNAVFEALHTMFRDSKDK